MTIAGDIIHHYEEKIRARIYVKVESFDVKYIYICKMFQKCDISFVILVLQNTHVVVFPPFKHELHPISYMETSIKYLRRDSTKNFQCLHLVQ